MADKEKDVLITVSAKNLTEADFKKVTKSLGGIEGAAGKATKKTSVLSKAFKSFGKAAPGALKIVAAGAAVTAGAIAGVTAAVIKLGERGAMVADVQSQFDALSEAAGETGNVMLTELAAGVKGTIGNFDLMKVANKALGAGLLDSSKDARTLSEGARLLAKRTGGDTVQAFNTLTTAMASGRTAQLKQLGLFVDNKAAIEAYADATGKSVSQLTDADRAAALQTATMAALRNEIASFPPPLADFGELIEKGKVAVGNLVDKLSVMISNSPVLLAGMRATGEAINKAFGNDQSNILTTIVNGVERLTFFTIGLGQAGIKVAQTVIQGFAGIKVVVLGVASTFASLNTSIVSSIATVLEAAANIPVLGAAYGVAAEKARAVADAGAAVSSSLKEQTADAMIAAAGNDTLGQALTRGQEILTSVSQAMAEAGTTTNALNTATAANVVVTGQAGAAAMSWAERLKETSPFFQEHMKKLEETKQSTILFGNETMFQYDNIKQNVGGFVPVMVGVGDTVAAQTASMAANFEFFGTKSREELSKTAAEAEARFDQIKASGTESAEALALIWEKVEEMKRQAQGETQEFTLSSNEAIVSGSSQLLQQLGTKNKSAAIAAALISTYLAVAKALASAPWPASLPLAAGALAAGLLAVNNIRKQKEFRTGTAGLDFQNFGAESVAALHGMEAVIPQGAGHALGREVASELARMGSPVDSSNDTTGDLREVFAELRGLPLAIQRSVRDGILLAG